MKLSEAFRFVFSVRPAWRDGKGKATTIINSNHVLRILGDIDVESITSMSFVALQDCCLAEGRSNGTTNRVTSVLSTLFTELKKHNMVKDVVRCPNQLREPKGRIHFFTEDEIEKMLIACNLLNTDDQDEIYDVVLMAARTGARQGELLKLKWTDVFFDEGVFVFMDTKTGSDRCLPFTPSIKKMLERKYAERIEDGLVFSISKDTLLRRFKKVLQIAGVTGEGKVFHTLRHSAATNLFAHGASLPEIQAILGHSRPETTMRYSHADMTHKAKALNYLEA